MSPQGGNTLPRLTCPLAWSRDLRALETLDLSLCLCFSDSQGPPGSWGGRKSRDHCRWFLWPL